MRIRKHNYLEASRQNLTPTLLLATWISYNSSIGIHYLRDLTIFSAHAQKWRKFCIRFKN